MYAAIRQGKAKTGMVEELARRIKEGAIPIISDVPGFRAYYVIYAPDDTVTAILLLANADFLVRMAQGSPSGGESGMDAINRLHGGMVSGPTGFSLPTMLQ